MADEERPETERNAASASSTRRNSQGSQNAGPGTSQWGTSSQTSSGDSRRRPPQAMQTQVESYGSITNPFNARQAPAVSPEATRPERLPRRPTGPTRRSTSTHAPHRGQEFSVDDAESEVADDEAAARRPPLPKSKPTAVNRPQVTTGISTVKRRPAAQAPSLAKVDSTSEDDGTHEVPARTPTDPTSSSKDNIASSSNNNNNNTASSGEDTLQAEEDTDSTPIEEEGDNDEDLSDAESFTLRDRQDAINVTHPFGIRIWKPALYKKNRSVQKNAEGDIHSTPGGHVSRWLLLFNIAWTILFGWWLALVAFFGALVCFLIGSPFDRDYASVLWGLAKYVFYPFGKYVKLLSDDTYAEEDEGEGRSISEYEQWQSGDIEEGRLFFGPVRSLERSLVGRRRNSADSTDETQSLLGRHGRNSRHHDSVSKPKRRLFGRGKWTFSRVVFFLVFYGLLTPCLFLVSGICWLFVFTIPMGRVTILLFDHLRRHPLALEFHNDKTDIRSSGETPSSVLLCTYRAVGSKYWKYTIDGTNIFFINLLVIVAFTIFDYFVLYEYLGLDIALTNNFLVFVLGLFSIIPLAYFIGQAVASISAQSSMGVGATINAFFSTVVEVFLYCVALDEGKAQLVEGSIIGSIFAGILFLPGLSMCFGAIKRKTQRFNVKSAGVTSTMLLFAVIGAFSPTLFYQIYGSHELNCHQCVPQTNEEDRDCRRCYFAQQPAVHDRFYLAAVRPYIWFCAILLFISYAIGLFFTLRTHAAVIWNTELDEKRPERMSESLSAHQHFDGRGATPTPFPTLSRQATRTDVRDTQLYRRILGQSLRQIGGSSANESTVANTTSPGHQRKPSAGYDSMPNSQANPPHVVPPKSTDPTPVESPVQAQGIYIASLSEEDNRLLQRQVAEMAATAATVAARDAGRAPHVARMPSSMHAPAPAPESRPPTHRATKGDGDGAHNATEQSGQVVTTAAAGDAGAVGASAGGHDAPNWSRTKSVVVLLTATVAYAIIAEILVSTVDAVLENIDIDEKFLGITLFSLVPNTTEFLNAISFAMNGNIALSMEIGSAYALQVCLLQIPALVLFSAVYGRFIHPQDVIDHTFTLIFPQWDMVTVILCVFLLSYMYGEGKSNYFKGSILILSYFVVVVGFYFSGFDNVSEMAMHGVDPSDRLALGPGMKMGIAKARGSLGGEL